MGVLQEWTSAYQDQDVDQEVAILRRTASSLTCRNLTEQEGVARILVFELDSGC